jgi:hypothetical protein
MPGPQTGEATCLSVPKGLRSKEINKLTAAQAGRTMDPVDQTIQILVGGIEQGGSKAIAIGTTAAAVAMWRRIQSRFRHNQQLDPELEPILAHEPGDEVDLEALRTLLMQLPDSELQRDITVYGDYVARDKNVFNL